MMHAERWTHDPSELAVMPSPSKGPVMADTRFGPGHPEWCPAPLTKAREPNDEHAHCECWGECEPCCRCGDDTPDPCCDCERCTAARDEGGRS